MCVLPCITRVLTFCAKINDHCNNCINAIWRKVAFHVWLGNGQWLNQTTGKIEVRYLENTPYYISNPDILNIESTL